MRLEDRKDAPMGLAERRAAKEFQDGQFPEWKRKIDAAAGFPVEVTVNWEQLAGDDYAHLYAEAWPKVYFEPLVAALAEISKDAMGKDALKGALKKIEIVNVGGIYYGDRWASFSSGVLKLDHQPFSNIDDVKDRTKGVVDLLEKSL
jgi:hypothetical protein